MRLLDELVAVVARQRGGQRLAAGQLRGGAPAAQRQRHRVDVDQLETRGACQQKEKSRSRSYLYNGIATNLHLVTI